jgi:hypothetical protein
MGFLRKIIRSVFGPSKYEKEIHDEMRGRNAKLQKDFKKISETAIKNINQSFKKGSFKVHFQPEAGQRGTPKKYLGEPEEGTRNISIQLNFPSVNEMAIIFRYSENITGEKKHNFQLTFEPSKFTSNKNVEAVINEISTKVIERLKEVAKIINLPRKR